MSKPLLKAGPACFWDRFWVSPKVGRPLQAMWTMLSTSCRIFCVFQGAILTRYKDTLGRDGWPWLPENSTGAGKTQHLFLQGCTDTEGCLYNSTVKSCSEIISSQHWKFPSIDVNPSQNFCPLKTNFAPEK